MRNGYFVKARKYEVLLKELRSFELRFLNPDVDINMILAVWQHFLELIIILMIILYCYDFNIYLQQNYAVASGWEQ
ncbi:hypothetical protein U3516DRAFT_742956 [Neocallimastix sp. 'constans']